MIFIINKRINRFFNNFKWGILKREGTIFVEVEGAMDYMIPTLSNRCKKEIEIANRKGIDLSKVTKPDVKFTYEENKKSNGFLSGCSSIRRKF